MSGFIEAIKRPFRGMPKYEAIPQEQALDALIFNFQNIEEELRKVDEAKLATKLLPKDEIWKFCVNVAQATELLYNECPPLPLPAKFTELVDRVNESKDSHKKTRVHPSWYQHGFDSQPKAADTNGPFFDSDGKTIKISSHMTDMPNQYSPKDPSLIGFDMVYRLGLISESQGKGIYISTIRRIHPRISASLSDPRENLTVLFPRQDKIVTEISFSETLGAGPVVVARDTERSAIVSGQDRSNAKKVLEVSGIVHYALREWSKQKDISDIRNWS